LEKKTYHDSNFHSTRYPMNTESSSDHMTTVHQAVLIAWIQSAKHFLSHDYCRPVLITRILSVRQFWSHDHCQHAVLITWLLSAKQFWSHDYCRPGNFYHMTTVRQFWSHEYCICWSGSHVPKTFFFSQEIFRQIIQNYFQSVLNKFNLCPNTHQTLYKLPESIVTFYPSQSIIMLQVVLWFHVTPIFKTPFLQLVPSSTYVESMIIVSTKSCITFWTFSLSCFISGFQTFQTEHMETFC
jgi:hypothetical protein